MGGATEPVAGSGDRKSTRLNSSHGSISYAVFCLKKKTNTVVDDIAVETDICKSTLYLYFPSKEQIYLAVLLEDAREMNRLIFFCMSAATTENYTFSLHNALPI